jgi:hypothetical protein
MQTHLYLGVRAVAAANLLGVGLALITAACSDAADPLGFDGTPFQPHAATSDITLNPQPEPPSTYWLPYHLVALGRGEFQGELGSCELQATLTLGETTETVMRIHWSFEAFPPSTGETWSGVLFGILNWTTGHTVSNGVVSSSLPAVQFRAHEQGGFTTGEQGEPSEFTGLVALNPQPEPPSVPPNPCVVEFARTADTR